MPKVYVGIVTYNSSADLPRCIASLREQTYQNIQITILDNLSSDDTTHWVQEHAPEAHLILNSKNIGFGRAHNQIVKSYNLDQEDYYLPLNPDVILMPDYIASLVAELQNRHAGWVIGKLRLLGSDDQLTQLIYSVGHAVRRDGYAFNIGFHQQDTGQFDSPREVFGAPAAAMLISCPLIDALSTTDGLFDTDMFMYFEDTDLDWRARLQGWACWYCPGAVAYHRGSSPGKKVRVDALVNRYLSVLKNAYLTDLIFYNFPFMVAHCLARLVLTPSLGLKMIEHLIRKSRPMWRKRQRPVVRRDVMIGWFQWSAMQPTGQSRSLRERLRELQRVK